MPMVVQAVSVPKNHVLGEVLPEWDFCERHSTFINASPELTMKALREVTPSELAPVFVLLFAVRFLPNSLLGQDVRSFDLGTSLWRQMTSGGAMPFVILGDEENEVCFGGIVDCGIIEVWKPESLRSPKMATKDDFVAFDDVAYLKVAAHFVAAPEGKGTRLETETRVRAIGRQGVVRFAPYWYGIRIGGGLVRRAWLDGVKRKAEL